LDDDALVEATGKEQELADMSRHSEDVATLIAAIEKASARIAEFQAENRRLYTGVTDGLATAEQNPLLVGSLTEPRESRRRVTFARVMTDLAADVARSSVDGVPDLRGMEPRAVVTALFQGVLGRPPDPQGLDYWAHQINRGADPVGVAEVLFESPEAQRAPLARHRRAGQFMKRLLSMGPSSNRAFVEALFAVGLRRAPTPAEVVSATVEIASGVGRDRMLTDFARRPEVRDLLLGARPRRPDRILRRWLRGRSYYSTFRLQVAEVEARRIGGPSGAVSNRRRTTSAHLNGEG
jgi:hypothetical protein